MLWEWLHFDILLRHFRTKFNVIHRFHGQSPGLIRIRPAFPRSARYVSPFGQCSPGLKSFSAAWTSWVGWDLKWGLSIHVLCKISENQPNLSNLLTEIGDALGNWCSMDVLMMFQWFSNSPLNFHWFSTETSLISVFPWVFHRFPKSSQLESSSSTRWNQFTSKPSNVMTMIKWSNVQFSMGHIPTKSCNSAVSCPLHPLTLSYSCSSRPQTNPGTQPM